MSDYLDWCEDGKAAMADEIPQLKARIKELETENTELIQECDRLRRELDEVNGVIR